jgi:hypothetical protein
MVNSAITKMILWMTPTRIGSMQVYVTAWVFNFYLNGRREDYEKDYTLPFDVG